MRLIDAKAELVTPLSEIKEFPERIERAGRVAFLSEWKIKEGSADSFIRRLIGWGHESVLEHCSFTARITCDRGVSHELVRHRLASFTQESTRYCNYSKDRFGNEITFIKQPFWEEGTAQYYLWVQALEACEKAYFQLLEQGASPQQARSVLPNSLKTEVVITANIREWRHIFRLRTSPLAHPQIREVLIPLLNQVAEVAPSLFSDLL